MYLFQRVANRKITFSLHQFNFGLFQIVKNLNLNFDFCSSQNRNDFLSVLVFIGLKQGQNRLSLFISYRVRQGTKIPRVVPGWMDGECGTGN